MEGPQLPGWMGAGCAHLSQKGQFLGWEEEALWQSGQNHFGPWLVASILGERLTMPLLSIPRSAVSPWGLTLRVLLLRAGSAVPPSGALSWTGQRQPLPQSDEGHAVPALSSQEIPPFWWGQHSLCLQSAPSWMGEIDPLPWGACSLTHACLPSTSCDLWHRELRAQRAVKRG